MKVFLSYSLADHALARQIEQGLRACGSDVWTAAITPGESLSESISNALNEADAYVLLLTHNASKSQWASLEAAGAVASGRRVIPVLGEPGAEVPLILKDRIYLDFTDQATRPEAIERLCEALQEPDSYGSGQSLREGIDAIEGASAALGWERTAHESVARERRAFLWRTQVFVSLIALVATLAGLVAASASGTAATAAVVSGVSSVIAAAVGFYFGSGRNQR
jgi:hypothetical protein